LCLLFDRGMSVVCRFVCFILSPAFFKFLLYRSTVTARYTCKNNDCLLLLLFHSWSPVADLGSGSLCSGLFRKQIHVKMNTFFRETLISRERLLFLKNYKENPKNILRPRASLGPNPLVLTTPLKCLNVQKRSSLCEGPAFIQPIRATVKAFEKFWLAGKKPALQKGHFFFEYVNRLTNI